jgi:hypothetical protein
MMNKVLTGFGYVLLMMAGLGWMDTLWIFGVEESQRYTWWGLIYWLTN